jgi:hypothetical protein
MMARRTLVASHVDVRMGLEVLREKIAQSVILLHEDEVGRVGHACREPLVSTMDCALT